MEGNVTLQENPQAVPQGVTQQPGPSRALAGPGSLARASSHRRAGAASYPRRLPTAFAWQFDGYSGVRPPPWPSLPAHTLLLRNVFPSVPVSPIFHTAVLPPCPKAPRLGSRPLVSAKHLTPGP